MASIHGTVYLLIGIGVTIASKIINPEKLKIFFYLGLLFIAWGVMKLFFSYIMAKSSKPRHSQPQPHLHSHKNPNLQTLARYCSRCGNMLHGHGNFCQYCGAPVYHKR